MRLEGVNQNYISKKNSQNVRKIFAIVNFYQKLLEIY